jgi:hypothetical protein
MSSKQKSLTAGTVALKVFYTAGAGGRVEAALRKLLEDLRIRGAVLHNVVELGEPASDQGRFLVAVEQRAIYVAVELILRLVVRQRVGMMKRAQLCIFKRKFSQLKLAIDVRGANGERRFGVLSGRKQRIASRKRRVHVVGRVCGDGGVGAAIRHRDARRHHRQSFARHARRRQQLRLHAAHGFGDRAELKDVALGSRHQRRIRAVAARRVFAVILKHKQAALQRLEVVVPEASPGFFFLALAAR